MFLIQQYVHETLAISHYVCVLSNGCVVASGAPKELTARTEVREAYFG
jgi:branched-chain amino acid transport system ATP-binding protein